MAEQAPNKILRKHMSSILMITDPYNSMKKDKNSCIPEKVP